MAVVAVTGDACTTTAVVLAAAWPASGPVDDVDERGRRAAVSRRPAPRDRGTGPPDSMLLVEADPTGGDLAAWMDLPAGASLSTVITQSPDGSWDEIARHIRCSAAGLPVIPAPTSAREAARAVAEAGRNLVPTLARRSSPTVIADVGCGGDTPTSHPFLAGAALTVLVHRQATQSSAAAAARLRRFADRLEVVAGWSPAVVVVIVGAVPFGLDEIRSFLTDAAGAHPSVCLPVDELSAAAIGGRSGVSRRRLHRLPLMRAGRDLAAVVESGLTAATRGGAVGVAP